MPPPAKYKLPLLAHCELKGDCQDKTGCLPTSYKEYLASRPKAWENEAVELMIKLLPQTSLSQYIVHVSSAGGSAAGTAGQGRRPSAHPPKPVRIIFISTRKTYRMQNAYTSVRHPYGKRNNDRLRAALKNSLLDLSQPTTHRRLLLSRSSKGNLLKALGGIAGLQFLLPAA